MLKMILPVAAVAVLAVQPAVAQDFLGGLARSAAAAAASRVANAAADRVANAAVSAMTNPRTAAPAPAPAPSTGATSPASSVSRPAAGAPAAAPASTPIAPEGGYFPAVINYRTGMKPYELQFSRDYREERSAMIDFTKYDCDDCEGGYTIGHHNPPERFSNWAQVTAGLSVGQTASWRMHGADTMSITVMSDLPIGDMPCKWAKLSAQRGQQSLDRPLIVCQGQIEDGGYKKLMGWSGVYGDSNRLVEQRLDWN